MTTKKFDYMHILEDQYGRFAVKGYDTWGRGSVLEGQTRTNFIDAFDSLEEAQKAYPEAELSHELMEPENTYDHLPDDQDY